MQFYKKNFNNFYIRIISRQGISYRLCYFFPNINFLLFDESYVEFLSLTDTGGNGKLNLLTYPVSLYFICSATCIQYLKTQQAIFLDFLILMWSAVLIARIISIFLRGGVVIDIYFFFGILPEFIIAPFFVFIKSKIS